MNVVDDEIDEKGGGLDTPLLLPTDAASTGANRSDGSGSIRKRGEETTTWSRNVKIILIYTFVVQVARSIWQAQILSIYLKDLSGSVRTVGYVEGVQGAVRLVSAIFIGYLVDSYFRKRKNAALLWSCMYGMCIFSAAAFCVLYVRKPWVWYFILAAYSPQRSLQMSIVGTILANSIRTGSREKVYTVYRVVSNLGSVVGPLIQIVYFFIAGDDWSTENLRFVMLIGIGFSASALPIQTLIDERRTLGNHSEARQRQHKDEKGSSALDDDVSSSLTTPPRRDEKDEQLARVLRWSIVVYDILRVLFGGLVDKYFGIFFQDTLHISPILAALIQMACRLCIVIVTALVGWLSKYVPAARVCLALLMLVNVANATLAFDPYENADASKWILVAAYVLRGSTLVSIFGLKHALLMDRVPKKHRGKFSALDDLQSGFWSGTAAVGGIVIDDYGYRTAFAIMGGGFGLATCSWLGVVYSDCVARREAKRLEDVSSDDDDDDDNDDDDNDDDRGVTDSEEGGTKRNERTGGSKTQENASDDDEEEDVFEDIGQRFSATMQSNDELLYGGCILEPSRRSVHVSRNSRSGRKKRKTIRHRFRSPSLPARQLSGAILADDFLLGDPMGDVDVLNQSNVEEGGRVSSLHARLSATYTFGARTSGIPRADTD